MNWRKRRRTAELIAANSTPNGVLMLAKADELDKYEAAGWTALRFWLHESPAKAAATVASVVAKVDAKN